MSTDIDTFVKEGVTEQLKLLQNLILRDQVFSVMFLLHRPCHIMNCAPSLVHEFHRNWRLDTCIITFVFSVVYCHKVYVVFQSKWYRFSSRAKYFVCSVISKTYCKFLKGMYKNWSFKLCFQDGMRLD